MKRTALLAAVMVITVSGITACGNVQAAAGDETTGHVHSWTAAVHGEEETFLWPVAVSDEYVRCGACGEEYLLVNGETHERTDGEALMAAHQYAVHGHLTNTSVVTRGRITGYETVHTGSFITVADQEA